MFEKAFTPAWTQGQTVTTGAASARVEIDTNKRDSIRVSNTGAALAYVRTGDDSVVATAADYIIPAGETHVFTKFKDDTHIAYIAPSGTPALHIMPGSNK